MLAFSRPRTIAFLLAFASLALAQRSVDFRPADAAAAAAAKKAPKRHLVLAPADQYFGPMKMSIVGMHTRIVRLGERYHDRFITDTNLVHDAKLVEAALYKWHDKYPKDPGAIATAFKLEQLYQVVQSTNARTHATTLLKYIAKAAPKSTYAHLSRLRLAQGFPPLVAESPTHATPNPYTKEADRNAASPVASASASAPASASASMTASATSSESPAPPVEVSPSPQGSPIAATSPSATASPMR